MGRATLTVGALGLALAAASCELTSIELADVEDVIVAEVYLNASGPQVAFLHRTLSGPNGSLRVEDAGIVVTGPAGAVLAFEPADASTCVEIGVMPEEDAGSCYASAAPVIPGESYDLDIRIPDGRRLRGQTTVPAGFDIARPAPDSCVMETPSLELVWRQSAGAWSYQAEALFTGLADGLAARGVPDPPDTLRLLGLAIGVADTTMLFPRDFGIFDRFQLDIELLRALQLGLPPGTRVELVIAAGDRNYVNWARGGNFNPSGQIRISSLTGDGVGVFGSLVGRGRTIVADGQEGAWPACETP